MAEAAYATNADFEGLIEGWTTTDPAALTRLLVRATDDIDDILGSYDLFTTGTYAGRKLDPTTLTYEEARAIKRATVFQAEYRFQMGEEFFVRSQRDSVSGPEFVTQGKVNYIGPKAMRELAGTGLLRNTTSIARGARVPSWLGFAYNIDGD